MRHEPAPDARSPRRARRDRARGAPGAGTRPVLRPPGARRLTGLEEAARGRGPSASSATSARSPYARPCGDGEPVHDDTAAAPSRTALRHPGVAHRYRTRLKTGSIRSLELLASGLIGSAHDRDPAADRRGGAPRRGPAHGRGPYLPPRHRPPGPPPRRRGEHLRGAPTARARVPAGGARGAPHARRYATDGPPRGPVTAVHRAVGRTPCPAASGAHGLVTDEPEAGRRGPCPGRSTPAVPALREPFHSEGLA